MKKYHILIILVAAFLGCEQEKPVNSEQSINTNDLILKIFEKGQQHCKLDFYAGTLMLHGMSEFALLEGNEYLLDSIVGYFEMFANGTINAGGNFLTYKAGGSGSAYLSWKNATDKLNGHVLHIAERLMTEQNRSYDNLMITPRDKHHQMFIDVAFTVTPYLLYSGLKFDKPEYVDYAVFQTLESFKILHDEETGLVHQGRGFQGEGVLSEDCWSRGNGWGAFALAILARDLPDAHPQRKEVEELATQFFTAVTEYQNAQGMFHQEMTAPQSYVETSGSGLLLYGLGLVLEKGLLPKKYMKNFETGIQNYLSYIGNDGSVTQSCVGCRCPGDGSKETYIKHPWSYNEHHAFGPAILALTQAAKMGFTELTPATKLGEYTIADSPETPRTYAATYQGRSMNWENDRIAFRVYGPDVKGQVGSGVDVWAKSVDYSIIDKWYKLNAEGKNYHEDRGEGCDFYNVGHKRGCGGLAIWVNGKPYGSEVYNSYRIRRNQDDRVEVDLDYRNWDVPGLKIWEKKKITMEMGSNLYKVTSTIHSKEKQEITIAIGLTTVGNADVVKNKENGFLSVWEAYEGNGNLGTGIVVNPENIVGFESYEGDEFVLIKVETNKPFSYYSGAGWDKSGQFANQEGWLNYLKWESEPQ